MPLRPLAISILIFIFIIIAVYSIYVKLNGQHLSYQIDSSQRWLGVVDLNADHGIDMAGVIRGEDALLVIDYTDPLLLQLIEKTTQLSPEDGVRRFELADYDSNKDGVLNQEDPIFGFLKILVFNPDTKSYEVRSLIQAGIRAIRVNHVNGIHKHQVILSDGSTRSVYEINQTGGTAIYKNRYRTTVTDFP